MVIPNFQAHPNVALVIFCKYYIYIYTYIWYHIWYYIILYYIIVYHILLLLYYIYYIILYYYHYFLFLIYRIVCFYLFISATIMMFVIIFTLIKIYNICKNISHQHPLRLIHIPHRCRSRSPLSPCPRAQESTSMESIARPSPNPAEVGRQILKRGI